ncbi:GAP family protein [Lysinibacter sp. HNR]|uniref:GAP family protein n=1 Tax=Lysinibacter sp. HNR TaxID=3031408 RepID=UPI002435BE27|nr:GAP family protein [Lysinibacter sp. HNR]WGD38613.1 GAP family protein [Lysinibacter sp. HNR]
MAVVDTVALGTLVVLALVDSTTFGTFAIPIWLLTVPGKLRIGRVLVYLATVTLGYFILGLVLLLGATAFFDAYGGLLESEGFLIIQLFVGVAFLVVSQLMGSKRARERAVARASAGEGKLLRWRRRIMSDSEMGGNPAIILMGLALTAVAIEAASMLPYLFAIGVITDLELAWPVAGALLLAYCVVMIAPALILTIIRSVAVNALTRPLEKMDQWFTKNGRTMTAWAIGIVGFLLVVRAIYDLGWFWW